MLHVHILSSVLATLWYYELLTSHNMLYLITYHVEIPQVPSGDWSSSWSRSGSVPVAWRSAGRPGPSAARQNTTVAAHCLTVDWNDG